MLNFAQLLAQAPAPEKLKGTHKRNTDVAHKTVRDRCGKRYAEAMGTEPITAPQTAAKLGITAQACLLQMYEYEKRGQVVRVGKVQCRLPNPPILWKWVEA